MDIETNLIGLDAEARQILALAKRVFFYEKDYEKAALLFNFALAKIPKVNSEYDNTQGMVTASYYGQGRHEEGLRFLCNQVAKDPEKSHRFRHAFHAHIRAIASDYASYEKAEEVVRKLQQVHNCHADDLTVAWIPIPLRFMEDLQNGENPSDSLSEEGTRYAYKILGQDIAFKEYLMLALGGFKNLKDIVDNYKNSYVRDNAIYELAVNSNYQVGFKYLELYLKEYPDAANVETIFFRAFQNIVDALDDEVNGGIDVLADATSMGQLPELLKSFIKRNEGIFLSEDVQEVILLKTTRSLSQLMAKEYLKRQPNGPNAGLAFATAATSKVEIASLNSNNSEENSQLFSFLPVGYDPSISNQISIEVALFKMECKHHVEMFVAFDFNTLRADLQHFHSNLMEITSDEDYVVSQWSEFDKKVEFPCRSNYATSYSRAKIRSQDMSNVINLLERLYTAYTHDDVETISEIAIIMHGCSIDASWLIEEKVAHVCDAFVNVFSNNFKFLKISLPLHRFISMNNNNEIAAKHTFLNAMTLKRYRDFENYLSKMNEFILEFPDSELVDDALTELGRGFNSPVQLYPRYEA